MMNCLISQNLLSLRKLHCYSQEQIAERIGVSRQAVAKWESGETLPDILNCDALATLYEVTLDDLIHYNEAETGAPMPPKGKHIFGTVSVGERGQIVLPKKSRDTLGIKPGDQLIVLGDTASPESTGLALIHSDLFLQNMQKAGVNIGQLFPKKEE